MSMDQLYEFCRKVLNHANQQPSLDSNILEGSETNSRILTDNAEDSNGDTSAEHVHIRDYERGDIVRYFDES